ncbi:PhoP/PhoQ regulator MgrB [Klebsiella michiganensis]|uniref:PhoP regulon feedback inhibition membrane protein MgrB n=1 Tax=Klebsiella pneumoniae TaxID=573 RepID=A0A484AAN0_KLEPN|nr:PhoP/PhoQ regulator MgrB [Klebsiella pneumoniae]
MQQSHQDVQFFSGICTINKFIPW